MRSTPKKTILRIELWHVLMLLVLVGALAPHHWVQPGALLIGGLFMGLNFLLLSFGVAWVLTPLAGRKRVTAGVSLLIVKILLFLGLLMMIFFRFSIDAISFSIGFSTLLLAIVVEAVRVNLKLGT